MSLLLVQVGLQLLLLTVSATSLLNCDAQDKSAPGQPAGQLVLPEGAQKPVVLVEILPGGELVTLAKEQKKIWQTSQFLRFGAPRLEVQLDTLVLNNGSLLAGAVTSVDRDWVELESRIFDLQRIRTRSLRGIIFRQRLNRTTHQKVLDRILADKQNKTKAVLINEDVVVGDLGRNSDPSSGLSLSIQSFDRFVKYEQLEYLMFPSLKPVATTDPSSSSRLGLFDGSRLVFEKMVADDKTVRWQLDENLALKAPFIIRGKSFFDRVCYYQPAHNNLRFLSTQSPLKVVEKSGTPFQRTNRNRSSTGGPLMFRSEVYEWGLGTHGSSQIIYSIEPADRILRVRVALDDTSHPLGSVDCRIVLLGQNNQWKPATPTLTVDRQESRLMEIKVSGAKAIGLVTSPGKHGVVGDRINWLDPRLLK